jgi:deoxyadenosine/deoxycytidine kinase
MTKKKYVIIEGLIGAGKTSLAKAYAALLGDAKVFLEPAEGANPYLEKYYEDPGRYAMHMQIFLLAKRFRAHTAAQSLVLQGFSNAVADRSNFGDRAFAEVQHTLGYFTDADHATYMELHKDMQRSILYPTCFVYLDAGVDLAIKRINRRKSEIEGRECEDAIDYVYMELLQLEIDRMMESLAAHTPVVRINPLDDNGDEKSTWELAIEVLSKVNAVQKDPYDAWQGVI